MVFMVRKPVSKVHLLVFIPTRFELRSCEDYGGSPQSMAPRL